MVSLSSNKKKSGILLTLTSIIWLFCSCQNSWAAFGAATAWECRTTGSSNNGGAFDSGVAIPGTDYSQQDNAEDSDTDLTCTDGDAAAPVIASLTHNFVAADEGNFINITEAGTGFTLGRYEIVDTSLNTATLDKACGANGALTGGDWYLGGGVDHPNTISTVVVAGNTIYIQNGTYVKVGANAYVLTTTVAGGNGTPVQWIGYVTNHSTIPTGTNRPVFDGDSDNNGTDDTASPLTNGAEGNRFENLIIKNGTTGGISLGGYSNNYINVRSTSSVDGLTGATSSVPHLINCEIDTNTDAGFDGTSSSSGLFLYGCYIHDNTNEGIFQGATGGAFVSYGNIIETNGSSGFNAAGIRLIAIGNIAYNNTGASSDGFTWTLTSGTNQVILYNNCSIDNGQYGFNRQSTTDMFPYFNYNNYNGNGTAGLNNITAGANDTTAAPAFTAKTTGDFTLSTGSDTALLGVGFPQTATNGLTGDYNVNIGLDQSKAASGGCADAFGVIQ